MKVPDKKRMNQLRFDGRVAVVTGAGGGLGKCYALLLASRGAKVVVNDLGGSRDGSGQSSNLADAVVKEIKEKGGDAVADYNSVVDGDKIIKTALDSFGRIDILINNAGILRDRSFARISDQDWDLIHAVHLKGAFKCTQAAWELFKKQKFGRVIMTSSNAGVCGNFGQANYSAAKLGLIGLANTLAIEGSKYNILINTIVPTARSRLTEDILSPEMLELLKPEFIAPVVAYMCHESFTDTSQVIDANLGFGTKIQYYDGGLTPLRAKLSDDVTIESVQEAWPKLTEMSKLVPHTNIRDQAMNSMQAHMELQEREQMDGNRPTAYNTYTYNERDVQLYALGVGASVLNKSDLRFLYENHEQFNMLPTFLVLAGVHLGAETATLIGQSMPPGKHADFSNILHGEQYIEIEEGKLPGTSDELTVRSYVASVLDKGSAAIVLMNSEIYNKEKEKIGRTQQHIFVLGQGGFGGPRTSSESMDIVPVPKRSPDAVVSQKTSEDQAALYRLSGDLNPLHIDSEFSAQMGHPKPILHGLCTLGFAGRHVLATYGGNDSSKFKAMKVRFMKPVLPGQTLVTEMWLEGKRVHFQTKVKETGAVCVGAAYMDLHNVVSGAVLPNKVSADLKSDSVFAMIKEELTRNPAKAKAVKGVFHFVITEGGKPAKKWTLDLKTLDLYEGEAKTKADTTITVSDTDFSDVAAGKLNPQQAFMKGKLKLSGNIMLMQKLAPLLKSEAKL